MKSCHNYAQQSLYFGKILYFLHHYLLVCTDSSIINFIGSLLSAIYLLDGDLPEMA